MQITTSSFSRAMPLALTLLLFARAACSQVILDTPAVEDVRLPSMLQDAFLTEEGSCKQACSAVQVGQGDLTAGGVNSLDPLSLQIVELRRELGDEFRLDSSKFALEGETATFQDPQVSGAEFLSALDAVSESDHAIESPEILGPSVMSENQAATLRYAADRVEQVAATLERADLAEQAALARSLAEAVLASPARRDRLARPATATFLR